MAEVYSAQTLSEIRLVIPTLDEKSEAIVARQTIRTRRR
jgi:hypothetical protein